MGRRSEVRTCSLPEPERASEEIIARCRREIEGALKAKVRSTLLPYWRWRYKLAELGEGFHGPPRGGKMVVGVGSRIGRYAYVGLGFRSQGPVVVGDLCMLAAEIRIVGADHLFDIAATPTRLGFPTSARQVTTFGLDSWVGARVTILEGVKIGAGAVVGSGSMVIRDVEPYTVVAGVPAKFIRKRLGDIELAEHIKVVTAATLPGLSDTTIKSGPMWDADQ